MLPPLPVVDTPVRMETSPESLSFEAPLEMDTVPVLSVPPAVLICTGPLEEDLLAPDVMATPPPILLPLSPPTTCTVPAAPGVLPVATSTSPVPFSDSDDTNLEVPLVPSLEDPDARVMSPPSSLLEPATTSMWPPDFSAAPAPIITLPPSSPAPTPTASTISPPAPAVELPVTS